MLYWLLKRIFIGPILRVLYRPWVDGIENVPAEGPAIIASNHVSFSDSIFLPLMAPRRITFPAKAEYFTGHGPKGWVSRAFMAGTGQVPMDRSGGKASQPALDTALRLLGEGQLFGIYPEGTRSPDGRLYKGKTGIARLVLEAKVPVIPVAMIGTRDVQPPGKVIPSIGRVGMRFGKPLEFSRYEHLKTDRYVLRAITDEIMYSLMELSGQEYADIYAQTAKEQIAAAKKQAKAEAAATSGESAAPAAPA